MTLRGMGKLFGMMEMAYILICVLATWIYTFVKTQFGHLRFACFPVYKLYL